MSTKALTRDTFSASPDAAPLLRLEKLSVLFPLAGRLLPAVQNVSLDLPPAAVTCLVGESGCGKSLTARAILRLTPEHAVLDGRALLNGQDLLSLPEKELRRVRGRRVGMIFQEPMTSLNPVLRVGQQAAEPLRLHLGMGRAEARREVERLFTDVGIPSPHSRYEDYPHQLSGGMRQRVMIAMALSCKPKLLIADEPTTALDVTIQKQILKLMKDLRRELGTAVILITHDLSVVAEMADRVAVMYAGEIIEQASVYDLFRKPLHPYTEGLINSTIRLGDERGRLPTIPGTVPPLSQMVAGCRFHPRCPHATKACRENVPPMVEYEGRTVRCLLYAGEGEQKGGQAHE